MMPISALSLTLSPLLFLQLQEDAALSGVRDSDIYVTPDEQFIPSGVKFPCIAIKDGAIENAWSTNLKYYQRLQVRVASFVQIMKPEDSIMSDQGILELEELVVESLVNNELGLSGIDYAFVIRQEASEMFGDETQMIQKKTAVFEYGREESL